MYVYPFILPDVLNFCIYEQFVRDSLCSAPHNSFLILPYQNPKVWRISLNDDMPSWKSIACLNFACIFFSNILCELFSHSQVYVWDRLLCYSINFANRLPLLGTTFICHGVTWHRLSNPPSFPLLDSLRWRLWSLKHSLSNREAWGWDKNENHVWFGSL
jgi:hypothetical protein